MSTFNDDNSNIDNIRTRHLQIMKAITNRLLELKPINNLTIAANYTLCTVLLLVRPVPSFQ